MGEVTLDTAPSVTATQVTAPEPEKLTIGQQFWNERGSQAVLDMKGSFGQPRLDERSQRLAFGIARLINGRAGIGSIDTKTLTEVVREEMLKFLEYYCISVAQIVRETNGWKITDPDRQEGIGILEGMLLNASDAVAPQRVQEFRYLEDEAQIPQRVNGLFEQDNLRGFDFYSSGEAMMMAGTEMAVMHLGGAFSAVRTYSNELSQRSQQVHQGAINFASGLVHGLGEKIPGQAWWKKEEFLKFVSPPPRV